MEYPHRFRKWVFDGRAEIVRKMLDGELLDKNQLFLGFTRHSPAVITDGPAGLNGSIKGTGFVPKEEFLGDILDKYLTHISSDADETYSQRGLELLWEEVWSKPERFDLGIMATIELAKRHTWDNLRANPKATILFYQPPIISYECRADVEIHTDGDIHRFVNAQHDVYHKPNPDIWAKRPVYLFRIKEITDKSVTKDGFGKTTWKPGQE